MKMSKGLTISVVVVFLVFGAVMAYMSLTIPGESIRLNQIASIETKRGPDHPSLVEPLIGLSIAYELAGRWEKAVPPLERAVKLLGKRTKMGVLLSLARNLDLSGNYEKANAIYDPLIVKQLKDERKRAVQRKAATAFNEQADSSVMSMSQPVGLPGILETDIAMLRMKERNREIKVIEWRIEWIKFRKAELAASLPEVKIKLVSDAKEKKQ